MKLNILLLCNKPPIGIDANTIVDHIEAFERYSEHKIWLCSIMGELPAELELSRFDVIIIHYSLSVLNNHYLSMQAKHRLQAFNGLKVIFIQDEYRQIQKAIDEFSFLKIDVLFTCFPDHEMNRIYPNDKLPKVSKFTNLTGYIPERLLQRVDQPLIKARPIDVGYRGRKLPFWYGELAYEKWSIVDRWKQYASRDDLNIDVSYKDSDRIYGEKWVQFLLSCKTTLGVESGASVMDFTGELEKKVDMHQLMHPNDSFHLVQKKYLLEHEGKYNLNQISPRCFEAIALKTVLVLYEGCYSGILTSGRHYIELKKDFSNIEAVLTCIRDDDYLQSMADLAYQEIALNPLYSYQGFVEKVDQIIATEFKRRSKPRVILPYNEENFTKAIHGLSLKNKLYLHGLRRFQRLSPGTRLVIKGCLKPKLLMRYLVSYLFILMKLPYKKKNRRESK